MIPIKVLVALFSNKRIIYMIKITNNPFVATTIMVGEFFKKKGIKKPPL